jgi:hypothetical protein
VKITIEHKKEKKMSKKERELIFIAVIVILAAILSNILMGCATTGKPKDVDTRGLTGKILQDGRTGKLLIPKYQGNHLFYLHEFTPNGEIIFYEMEE